MVLNSFLAIEQDSAALNGGKAFRIVLKKTAQSFLASKTTPCENNANTIHILASRREVSIRSLTFASVCYFVIMACGRVRVARLRIRKLSCLLMKCEKNGKVFI